MLRRLLLCTLLCVALSHLLPLQSSSSGSLLTVRADASAFADEADEPHWAPNADDDDPVPVAAASSTRGSASAPTAAPVRDLDEEDAAELLADDDEFVGGAIDDVPAKKPAAGKKAGKKAKGKKKSKVLASPAQSADHNEATVSNVITSPKDFLHPIGLPEYIGLALLAFYIVNFALGSMRNAGVAAKASELIKPLLEEQFEAVGTQAANRAAAALTPSNAALPPVSAADAEPLEKDSPACYKLYASGRRHVESALLTLDLQPRQDLWGLLLSVLDLATSRDTLTIELPFDDDSLAPMVFAVLRKKFAKKMIKAENMTDLEGIPASNAAASASASSSSSGASKKLSADKYTVLSELGPEIEAELLSDRVVRLLSKPAVEALFLSLHISDQSTTGFSLSRKVLRARFLLPSNYTISSAEEDSPAACFQSLVRLVFQLVDRLGELKLTPALKARSEARRKKIAEALAKSTAKERAEAQFLRKQEQKRKEAEIIASDPTSELARELLRKREAKEAKLQKKMKGSNVKVMR